MSSLDKVAPSWIFTKGGSDKEEKIEKFAVIFVSCKILFNFARIFVQKNFFNKKKTFPALV